VGRQKSGSRPGSKGGSGLEPTQKLAEDSIDGSSWQLKYMENVRTCNSKRLRRKQQEKENQTGTSAEPRSAG
jgi:hypothetical protein